MSYSAKDANAAWKLTSEQEAKVLELTSVTEISAYIRECGLKNNVVQQLDGAPEGYLVDVPQTAKPTATMKIGDTVLSGTQEEVNAQLAEYLKTHPQGQQDDQPARGADGRFRKEAADQREDANGAVKAAAAAELELRFKRGEVSAAEYIAQSGVLESYLASKGIDVNAHQESARHDTEYMQSWAEATKQWIEQHPDWQGGEDLKNAMAERLQKLGLADYPSVESLNRAYAALTIEAEMHACTGGPDKMAELRERYRREAQGILNSRGTATF